MEKRINELKASNFQLEALLVPEPESGSSRNHLISTASGTNDRSGANTQPVAAVDLAMISEGDGKINPLGMGANVPRYLRFTDPVSVSIRVCSRPSLSMVHV